MAAAGKARSTIRLARTVLVLALSHAERRDLVGRNAARLSIVPPAPTRESRSLTVSQARSLLSAARGDRLEAAWVTMLLLGLRPGEVFALAWQDIDLEAGVLHVRRAIRRAGGSTFTIGEPKTARSRRSLDLPALVAEALRSHRTRQATERLAAGSAWQDAGLVFTSTIGTMLDPAIPVVRSPKSPRRRGSAVGIRTRLATRPCLCSRRLASGSRTWQTSSVILRARG